MTAHAIDFRVYYEDTGTAGIDYKPITSNSPSGYAPRGRVLSDGAWKHLGLKAPKRDLLQSDLLDG